MDYKILIALLLGFGLAGAAPQLPQGATSQIPAWLDTNGDGFLSELERQAFAEARKNADKSLTEQWDKDDDGDLDETEQQSAMEALAQEARKKLGELFMKVAGDDGQLSIAEFITINPVAEMPSERAGQLFNLLDTDKGGLVSMNEFIANSGGPQPPKGKERTEEAEAEAETEADAD